MLKREREIGGEQMLQHTKASVARQLFKKDAVEHIENFDKKTMCKDIGQDTWGYIDYRESLPEKEADAYEQAPARKMIEVDFSRADSRNEVMERYGDIGWAMRGKNQDGEDVEIHVSPENMRLVTYQQNGWVRRNTFYYREDTVEEEFDGKWR